jgi:DNA mismatch repair protein MutS
MEKNTKTTPLIEQYFTIKQDYPEMLLLFQVGDFYELFFEDAQRAAAFLGIALTSRGMHNQKPIDLCGVPVHAIDHYLHKLIKGGFCVAICDQLELPQPGKIVKRGVTQVLTPGTLTDSKLLDARSASYLCAFVECEGTWGLLFSELLTAQLYATVIPAGSYQTLQTELSRFFPHEVLLAQDANTYQTYFKKQGYFTNCIHTQTGMLEWAQKKLPESTYQQLQQQQAVCTAVDLLYHYIKKNNQAALDTFATIHFYQPEDFLILDAATQKNLELLTNLQDGGRSNSLLDVLDKTCTAMGSRTLKKWLVRPLVNKNMIEHRFAAVEYLKDRYTLQKELSQLLRVIADAERIVGRISLQRGLFQDYVALIDILKTVPFIKKLLQETNQPLLVMLAHSLAELSSLYHLLLSALHDNSLQDYTIKEGFDQRLDRLRNLIKNSQTEIAKLEQQEQTITGINSLKIRFTTVHGYYVEITQSNLDAVPAHYKRRQTLVNRERFTFPALQELEHQIMTAHHEIKYVETEIFEQVKQQVTPFISQLRKTMHALAQIDVLLSFAICAYERGYTKPRLTDKAQDIIIKDGKHPVIEQKLGFSFIPNDTQLDDNNSLWIITGPNMGGKSTYLRQVAQLCLMAQCGSFIPAKSASLPLLDRIFTRIGASDNVAEGKSTFLVEMEETADICRFATEKSLVILDEVGRGTSTFDGVALAQAVVEYLFKYVKARCLFATHYHELTHLEKVFQGIVTYHVASKKTEDGIVFLHKMVRGVAQGSFGLEVAKLAHLPELVIQRAYAIEQKLSQQKVVVSEVQHDLQLQQLKDQVVQLQQKFERLKAVDFDALSPKKAFDILWEFKQ